MGADCFACYYRAAKEACKSCRSIHIDEKLEENGWKQPRKKRGNIQKNQQTQQKRQAHSTVKSSQQAL